MEDGKKGPYTAQDVTITIGGVEVQGYAEPFWPGDDQGVVPDAFSVAVPVKIELTTEGDAARTLFKLTPEDESERAKFRKYIDDVLESRK